MNEAQSHLDQMVKLRTLRDSGSITDEEFEVLRAKLSSVPNKFADTRSVNHSFRGGFNSGNEPKRGFKIIASVGLVIVGSILSYFLVVKSHETSVPTCNSGDVKELVEQIVFKSNSLDGNNILIGYSEKWNITDVAQAEIDPKPSNESVRKSKVHISGLVFRSSFKFDLGSPRQRDFVEKNAKRFCLADLSATFDKSAAAKGLPAEVFVSNLFTGGSWVSSEEAIYSKAQTVKWANPLRYAVQITEDNTLYVTFE